MTGGIEIIEDNTQEVHNELAEKVDRALTTIGIKAENAAKKLCPVGTPESTGKKSYRGGTLRNSITNSVNIEEKTVTIGTNVEYAPYVELGTGPNFEAPPEWEEFETPEPSGIGHGYVRPRPYLKPAILDHLDEYTNIIENELKG